MTVNSEDKLASPEPFTHSSLLFKWGAEFYLALLMHTGRARRLLTSRPVSRAAYAAAPRVAAYAAPFTFALSFVVCSTIALALPMAAALASRRHGCLGWL